MSASETESLSEIHADTVPDSTEDDRQDVEHSDGSSDDDSLGRCICSFQ